MQAESSFQIEASQEFQVSGKNCKSFPTSRICHVFDVVHSCSNYSCRTCLNVFQEGFKEIALLPPPVGLTQI